MCCLQRLPVSNGVRLAALWAIALGVLAAGAAHGDAGKDPFGHPIYTGKDFLDDWSARNSGNTKEFRFLIESAMASFSVANAKLISLGEKPLYCQPFQLQITTDQAVSILHKARSPEGPEADARHLDFFPFHIILLESLRLTFPCTEDSLNALRRAYEQTPGLRPPQNGRELAP